MSSGTEVQSPSRASPRVTWLWQHRTTALLVSLAVGLTVINAIKPVLIDDSAYIAYARQAATHPLDPYGFEFQWGQWPRPAMDIVVPPLLPYWLAIAIRLFGDGNPVLLKLWMFPFAWLLVHALYRLLRRLAPGTEWPVLLVTVLSPVFLATMNLMLDVPALALALAAVEMFLQAADVGNLRPLRTALYAGVIAGLAMLTKYNYVLLPGVLAIAVVTIGLLERRWTIRPFVVATAAWAGVIVLVEGLIALKYGTSHFLHNALHRTALDPLPRLEMIEPMLLLTILVGLPVVLLSVVALTGRLVWLAVSVVPAGYLAWVAAHNESSSHTWGIVLGWAMVGVVVGLLLRRASRRSVAGRAMDLFLTLWLGVEIASYLATAPFPAARRHVAIVAVLALCAARLASHRGTIRRAPISAYALAVLAAAYGLVHQYIDYCSVSPVQVYVEKAVEIIRSTEPNARIFGFGHWGTQYYMHRAGVEPLVADETIVPRGSYIIIPPTATDTPLLVEDMSQLERTAAIRVPRRTLLTTVPTFYASGRPLSVSPVPYVGGGIYHAKKDWPVLTDIAARDIAKDIRDGGSTLPPRAAPFLVRLLNEGRMMPADAETLREQLFALGSAGLRVAIERGTPAVRRWAVQRVTSSDLVDRSLLAQLQTVAMNDPDPVVRQTAHELLQRQSQTPPP